MKNSMFFVSGMLALLLAFVFALTGCPTGGGGNNTTPTQEGISTPTVINGFYGVTADGKTIQIVITSPGSGSVSRAINWRDHDVYTAYVDGKVVSRGTITASSGSILFTATDGATVSPVNITGGGIIITTGTGTTYSGNIIPAEDYYYCIGATTDYTESQINRLFSGKTPEQVYNECSIIAEEHFDYPDTVEGTWAEIKAFAKLQECPDSIVSSIAKKLDNNVSAWGYYRAAQYNSNVMFYIARVPLM